MIGGLYYNISKVSLSCLGALYINLEEIISCQKALALNIKQWTNLSPPQHRALRSRDRSLENNRCQKISCQLVEENYQRSDEYEYQLIHYGCLHDNTKLLSFQLDKPIPMFLDSLNCEQATSLVTSLLNGGGFHQENETCKPHACVRMLQRQTRKDRVRKLSLQSEPWQQK